MVDKTLEQNITKTQTFLELWTKFHELYRDAVSDDRGMGPKGEIFISTRGLVNSKFDDLIDSLKKTPRCGITQRFLFYEILSLKDLSTMSDERLDKIKDCWMDSYIFLYGTLDRFKKKKQRIEKFNKFFFIMKRLVMRGGRR